MKTRILARVFERDGLWAASAFSEESAFCSIVASSDQDAEADLRQKVAAMLDVRARAWLEQWQHGGDPDAPNCPEGAVKLPIDLWVCKLYDTTCPLQAQVSLRESERFYEHCLAPPEKKQAIFKTVDSGEYSGFHHVPGRFLCVWCEVDGKQGAFAYHYPWEMTHVTALFPFPEKDVWKLMRRLKREGLPGPAAYGGLCAQHCKQLIQLIEPSIGASLRITEFELFRPGSSGSSERAT